jgi:hypothetical protein
MKREMRRGALPGAQQFVVGEPVALNEMGWKYILVLVCPSLECLALTLVLVRSLFARMLKEIVALFGHELIATH